MFKLIDYRLERGIHLADDCLAERAFDMLIVVTYGQIRYRVDGNLYAAAKGDVVYIPSESSYEPETLPNVFHEKYVACLDRTGALTGLPLIDDRIPRILKPTLYEWMADRLKLLHDEWQEQAHYSIHRCEAILLELAAICSRELRREPISPSSALLAERMKAYIAGHYREKITKEELGAAIGRTPNHAAALFKRSTGQTISEYAHSVRIKTAVYMLKESLLTAGEISEYLGYRDLSYFHRIFKKTTGYPPAHYMSDRNSSL